jgi:hypothetical protein
MWTDLHIHLWNELSIITSPKKNIVFCVSVTSAPSVIESDSVALIPSYGGGGTYDSPNPVINGVTSLR